jgi:hypothetical protein
MISVEVADTELVIRVPRRDALSFSALVEDALRGRALPPNETDFRQRAVAAITAATADLLRYRPSRPAPPRE